MNRYLVLLPGDGHSRPTDNPLLQRLLDYLDDRSWSVRVWYHGRLPRWLRASPWLSNCWYGVRLACTPKSTIMADSRLYRHVAWSMRRPEAGRGHEWLLVAGAPCAWPANRAPCCQVVVDQPRAWAGTSERLFLLPVTGKSLLRELNLLEYQTPALRLLSRGARRPACLQEALERMHAACAPQASGWMRAAAAESAPLDRVEPDAYHPSSTTSYPIA